jgi:hypothetical protein
LNTVVRTELDTSGRLPIGLGSRRIVGGSPDQVTRNVKAQAGTVVEEEFVL